MTVTNTDQANTGAAHIVTSEAVALGDPEVIIMTQADESGAADEIERYPLSSRQSSDPQSLDVVLFSRGWNPVGDWTVVERGYLIVNVERIRSIV